MVITNISVLLTADSAVLDDLGAEGKRIYEEACKKGKVRIIRVLCDTLGEEESGKSCFADSLMDKPYIPNRESTNGVKVKMMTHAIGDGTNWKELANEKERQTHISRSLAKKYVNHLRQQSKSTKKGNDGTTEDEGPVDEGRVNDAPVVEVAVDEGLVDGSSHVSQYEHFQDANKPDADAIKAIVLMNEDSEEMSKCENTTLLTLMDRGGQDQFLSTHAALMADDAHQSTVCFLVIDGSKPLDEEVLESKFRLPDGRVIKKPRDNGTTRADLIRCYFTALSAAFPAKQKFPNFLGMELKICPPATFIVLTRKDETESRQEWVTQQETKLWGIICEQKFAKHIVQYEDKNGDLKFVFHVDNTKSGTGNPDDTILLIKKMIVKMASKRWSDKDLIPVSWVTLDKGLGQLQMAGHEVLDIRSFYETAAEKCGIAVYGDFQEALKYLCNHGSIGFYHNVPVLKEKVLPNLQWAADMMAIFVTVVDEANIKDNIGLNADLNKLHQTGVMSWDLAKFLLDEAQLLLNKSKSVLDVAPVVENVDDVILNLLALFDVIEQAVSVSSKAETEVGVERSRDIYVPCMVVRDMIKTSFAYQLVLFSSATPPPLFIVPKGFSIFLKPLFYRLVVRMIRKYSSNNIPNLSRKQVILHIDQHVSLELAYIKEAVVVTVFAPDGKELPQDPSLRPMCFDVRETVVKQLTQAKKRGMDGFEFELCVHNALDELSVYDPSRLASLEMYPGSRVLVDRNGDSIVHPRRLCVWYNNCDEGKYIIRLHLMYTFLFL